MSISIGVLLGVGLMLIASVRLWPATARSRADARPARLLSVTLARAGLARVHPGALVTVSVLGGLSAAAITFALVPVAVLGLVVGACVSTLPVVIVRMRARARTRSTRAVWPDLVDHLVSCVRAGMSLPDSLGALAENAPESVRDAFHRFAADYRARGDFGLCLDELKGRLADPTADRLIETLRLAREVGGQELTTVLRNLAAFLRQEGAIRAEVLARQSWVVIAARLGVLAPWVVLLLLATRPEAAAAYNTPTGTALVLGGLGVSAFAYRVMVQIGRLPAERRWFA